MKDIIHYEHHGANVAVMEENKGLHRENCLCFQCREFYPEPEKMSLNCPIARILFSLCQAFNIVTPVWECEKFTLGDVGQEAIKPTSLDIEWVNKWREKK